MLRVSLVKVSVVLYINQSIMLANTVHLIVSAQVLELLEIIPSFYLSILGTIFHPYRD